MAGNMPVWRLQNDVQAPLHSGEPSFRLFYPGVSYMDNMFNVHPNMLNASIKSWKCAGMSVSTGDVCDAKAVRTHPIVVSQTFWLALTWPETRQIGDARAAWTKRKAVLSHEIQS